MELVCSIPNSGCFGSKRFDFFCKHSWSKSETPFLRKGEKTTYSERASFRWNSATRDSRLDAVKWYCKAFVSKSISPIFRDLCHCANSFPVFFFFFFSC